MGTALFTFFTISFGVAKINVCLTDDVIWQLRTSTISTLIDGNDGTEVVPTCYFAENVFKPKFSSFQSWEISLGKYHRMCFAFSRGVLHHATDFALFSKHSRHKEERGSGERAREKNGGLEARDEGTPAIKSPIFSSPRTNFQVNWQCNHQSAHFSAWLISCESFLKNSVFVNEMYKKS